jgi:thiamine kinase-like enzyme
LTARNWTKSVERNLRGALNAIHALGVIHGDIRLDNILIGKDGKVWFIDFETAFPADSIVSNESREKMFQLDRDALAGCLNNVRTQI